MGNLNQGQQHAAECGPGAHLVLAGPGTGKTTTLVARFAHLVALGIDPTRVLAVTFTRKAGEEMLLRLKQMVPVNERALNVGTFHSFAAKILRPYAASVHLNSDFRILDERGQRNILQKLGIFWNPENGGELTEIFAAAKARMMMPEPFRAHVEAEHRAGRISANDPLLEAVDHYHDYQQALVEDNACDFEDLILYSVQVLEQNQHALQEVSSRFQYILVDEFQDVNEGQFRLLRALMKTHGNLWCVGDDDQSIYSFRGAQSDYSLSFQKFFKNAEVWRLQENYRSSEQILALAANLISFNTSRYAKSLVPTMGSGPPVVVQDHPNVWAEADWTAEAVKKVLSKGIPGREIAVLFRVGLQAFLLQRSFQTAGIAYVLRGAGDYWQMAPVRYLRGMLLLAADGPNGAGKRLMGPGKRSGQFAKKALAMQRRSYQEMVKQVCQTLVDSPPQSYGPEKVVDYVQRIHAAGESAKSFESVAQLESWVEKQSRALQRPDPDAVVLSTIHSAKGLEWHTVFLVGFEQEILPHALSEDTVEEERRLAYVALSRAKRFLCLSFCHERYDEETGASSFLLQLLSEAEPNNFAWRGEGELPTLGRPQRCLREISVAQPKPYVAPKRNGPLKKQGPANNGLAWTAAEDRRLLRWYQKGMSDQEIAAKLERSDQSVKRRIDRLNALDMAPIETDNSDNYRDNLIEEVLSFMDPQTGKTWMNTACAELGGDSPWLIAKTEKGLKKALKALKKQVKD